MTACSYTAMAGGLSYWPAKIDGALGDERHDRVREIEGKVEGITGECSPAIERQ
jgi:hypothetical protein